MAKNEPNFSPDPELTRQIDLASTKDDAVEAVFILSPDDPSEVVPSSERTEKLTRQVLERVKKSVGRREKKVNIFRNMGSFVVSADPTFLRELMSQPEIAGAMANRQPGAASFGSVKKRIVRSSDRAKAKKAKGKNSRTKKK